MRARCVSFIGAKYTKPARCKESAVYEMTTSPGAASVVIFGGPFWTQDLPKLLPGAHIAVISTEADCDGIEGRKAGYELRDTLLVLGPGLDGDWPTASYVLLFRKSLAESTVAEQILSTGTGALNIDGCRVASDLSEFYSKTTGKVRSSAGHAKLYGMKGVFGGDTANPPHEAGRWPPNVLIVHAEGCKPLGMKRVKGGNDPRGKNGRIYQGGQFKEQGGFKAGHASEHSGFGENGTESVPSWDCKPNCPVPFLDSDTGGASRYFPQFKDDVAMMEWLHRLIAPGVHEVT
jgi:hypothetical protein